MKHTIAGITVLAILSISASSYAADADVKNTAESEYSTTTSRNPLTKNTTHTTTRKSKRNLRNSNGKASSKNELKVEKKVSDDGSKVRVRTEETRTEKE